MGRRGGKNFRGRNRKGGGGGAGRESASYTSYADVEKKNPLYEGYYNEFFDEKEREEMWAAMRRELPNSFRFTGSKGHALTVQQHMIDEYFPTITSLTYNDRPVDPPQQLKWYPEQLAWSMTTPKQVVRKFPPFASFQKFLVSETTVGNISRQEVVSMIPPLFMDIKPNMTVLDLCAAPGSKTAQLLEAVHGGEEARVRKVVHELAKSNGREVSPDGTELKGEEIQVDSEEDYSDDGRSTGLLIANDVDWKRAQLLIHQTKRLNSPNLIVTNHDARHYPSILLEGGPGQKSRYLKFDRILADVPCTGDGTARKNVNVWKDWTIGNALNLHGLQSLILIRALQMLKVGGRVVYSTCSMNPIENEAVISSVIDRCGGPGAVAIVDCSDRMPDLKRRPGLTKWNVVDKSGRKWESWAQTVEAMKELGEEKFGKVVEGMFPIDVDEGEERIPLERCLRVYPHLQDTGGFFITVLEKRAEVRGLREPPSKRKEAREATAHSVLSVNGGAPVPAQNGEAQKPAEDKMDVAVPVSTVDELVHPPPNENAAPLEENLTLPSLAQATTGAPLNDIPTLPPLTENAVPPQSPKRPREDDADVEDGSSKRVKAVEAPSEPAPAPPAVTAPRPNTNPNAKKSGQVHEEPFKYLDATHEAITDIFSFYEIASRFPRDRFMVRNAAGEPAKSIYYTSALARQILTLNEGSGIKFVHCGVKMFVKQDAQGQDVCRWRIQSEGLPIIEHWVGESRIVRMYKRPTLQKLLLEMFPRVAQDGWKDMGEIGERARDITMGCAILRIEPSEGEDGFQERMVLPLWRSMSSLNLMLPKEERRAMLLRVYNDESPLVDQHAVYREQKAKREQEAAAAAELEAGDEEGEEVAEDTAMEVSEAPA